MSKSNSAIRLGLVLIHKTRTFLIYVLIFSTIFSSISWPQAKATSSTFSDEQLQETSISPFQSYKKLDVDSKNVPLVSEDTSKRTLNEKYFKKLDGTFEIALYSQPVHYYKNGKWEDIDNTLEYSKEKGTYSNLENDFTVDFPNRLEGNQHIQLKKGEYQILWKPTHSIQSQALYTKNKKTSLDMRERSKLTDEIIYQNIFPNVDLQYFISSNTIKENIIVHNYVEGMEISFDFSLMNLELAYTNNGKIEFINLENQVVFSFSDLFIFDSENQISTDIECKITEQTKNSFILTLIPNNDWMKNATYPITIDPTIVSTTQSIAINDTYISKTAGMTNFSNTTTYPYLYIGKPTALSEYNTLFNFAIPSALADKQLIYAHLTLDQKTNYNGIQINLFKNTTSFNHQTVVWKTKPSYETNVVDFAITSALDDIVFDVTEPLSEWHNAGIIDVPGFTLAYDDIVSSTTQFFRSSSINKPFLTIGYQERSGIKDYWTYNTQEMGKIGTGYLSDYTGNLTWIRDEYFLENENMPLKLSFFHNHDKRNIDIGYGSGWKTNFHMQILLDTYSQTYYMTQGDGNQIHFMNEVFDVASGAYVSIAEDGSRMKLYRYGDHYTVKTLSKMEFHFDNTEWGRLLSIYHPKSDQQINITYLANSIRIDCVTDDVGNMIDFAYYNNRLVNTQLKLIDDSSYSTIEKREYFYDSYNNLDFIRTFYDYNTEIGYPLNLGPYLHYTFNSNHEFVEGFDTYDNLHITYNYETSGKVQRYTMTSGLHQLGYMDVLYSFGRTQYVNHEGESTYYSFDQYGHTVNVLDDYGTGQSYDYAGLFSQFDNVYSLSDDFEWISLSPNYANVHHLIYQSAPFSHLHNPIKNHGFENSGDSWLPLSSYGFTATPTTNYALMGDYSYALKKDTSTAVVQQSIFLKAGEYMLTYWVLDSVSPNTAFINVLGSSTLGTVTGDVNLEGWTQYQRTLTLNNDAVITLQMVNLSTDFVYFDNIQINEGFIDTQYNMLQNDSFEEGTTDWVLSGAVHSTIIETSPYDILGDYAIKIIGDGGNTGYFYQSIIDFEAGDVFTVGGWAKADAVPSKLMGSTYEPCIPSGTCPNDYRYFGIQVIFITTLGEWIPTYYAFNSDLETWQFQSRTFVIPDGVESAYIYGVYRGEGTAYFDNFQLYKGNSMTVYGYDNFTGHMMKVVSAQSEYDFVYDADNEIQSITRDGQMVHFDFDPDNLWYQLTQNNVVVSVKYDDKGHITEHRMGYDFLSSNSVWFMNKTNYSIDGQYITSVIDEFNNTTMYEVDYENGLRKTTTDAFLSIETLFFDSLGRINEINRENLDDTLSIDAEFTYNSSGNLATIVHNGVVYAYFYDDLERIESITINSVEQIHYTYGEETIGSIVYDNSLLINKTYGNGDGIHIEYTDLDQVRAIFYNDETTPRYMYEYDTQGRLAILMDLYHNDIFFYTYDQYGNLFRIVDEDDNSIEYVYDETQRLEKYAYIIGTYQREVSFYYDQTSGRADYMQYEVGGMTVSQEYDYDQDSLQRVRSIDTLIGTTQLTESFIYDDSMVNSNYGNATMRIYAIEYAKNDVTQSKHTFFYDEMHNIIDKIIYNELNAVIERHTYNYDGFSRLIRENLYVEGATPDVTRVFAYDSLGNITSIQDYAYTLSQEITTSPYKESHLIYSNPTRPDQLSLVTHKSNGTITHTTSYTYDASGNPSAITDSRGSFYSIDLTFDGRELVGYQRDDVMDVSYTYDDQGIRKTKVVDGVLHAYTTDQGRVIAESIGSNTHLYYTYDGSGRLFSMNYNGTEYFYRLSLQGDVIGLYDAYGNEVASYIYDAYGNEIRATGILKDINPYRYRSYRFEEETGYYYLQSRYYDPSIGRFISQDGMGYLDPSNHRVSTSISIVPTIR